VSVCYFITFVFHYFCFKSRVVGTIPAARASNKHKVPTERSTCKRSITTNDHRKHLYVYSLCLLFENFYSADGKTLIFKTAGMQCEQVLKYLEQYAPPSPPPAAAPVDAKKADKKSDTTKGKKK
jgi:hypothetical protein